ncbi:MAG: threonine/serine dehydratase [Euzebya sp.]
MTHIQPTPTAIAANLDLIRPYIRHTPVLELRHERLANPVVCKLEYLQHAGSFKPRGAFTNLLTRPVPSAGVVAASGGNHGAAVAYAAGVLGHQAQVFVPSSSSAAKVAVIRAHGAQVHIGGEHYTDALAASREWAADTGALTVHAFDAPQTILGQGSVGIELIQQAPRIDTVLVAVGGGGLIGGIAAALTDDVRVIGVEPASCPTLQAAMAAGYPVDVGVGGVAADSLGARRLGRLVWPLVQRYVDDSVVVADEDIIATQQWLWQTARIVVEPGGAAAMAALHCGAYQPTADEAVAVVLCGANTDRLPSGSPGRMSPDR